MSSASPGSLGDSDSPRWSVVRKLGSGAVADVTLVRLEERFDDHPVGTLLACKRPRADANEPEAARMSLQTEAEISERVEHPSLVDVLGYGEDELGPFLLSRYVEGPTLGDLLGTEGALPEPTARRIGADLAGALRALHAAGFVHGDLKPENVRLDAEDRAVLLDLGLARLASQAAAEIAGSLPYLAPERLRGGGPSTSADVFALGVLLFELRTGEHPFAHGLLAGTLAESQRLAGLEGADELIALQTRARLVPPSHLAPETSALFDALAAATLDPRPPARPSAEAVVRILQEGEAGPWWRSRVARAAEHGAAELWFHSGRERLPLVGRTAEIARLQALWERSIATPRTSAALLRGPTGSGSSRLGTAFAELVRSQDAGALALFARCSDTAEARPFGALLELPRRWLQLPSGTAPGEREQARVRDLLPPRSAEILLNALDPDSSEALLGSLSLSLARWLAALSERRPLIVVIDGLERARTSTLAAIGRISEELSGRPSMLLLTLADDRVAARPEQLGRLLSRLRESPAESHGEAESEGLLELRLGNLLESDVFELVRRLFHHTVPRLRLAGVLWDRSRGNPALLAELLADLRERGDATGDESGAGWKLTVLPDDLPLPRSLTATIRDRLERLDPVNRAWLERFSVFGGNFSRDQIQLTFTESDARELDAALAELHRRGWLETRGNSFRLASPAYQRAARAGIDPERRRRLHRLIVRRLEAEGAAMGTLSARLELARHLRSAGEPRALLDHLAALMELVARRGSPQRVLRLAHWGLEALDELPASRFTTELELELLELGVDAADRFGNRSAERELLSRLMERSDADGSPPPATVARLALLHARYSSALGQVEIATRLLAHAVEHATLAGDPALISEAHRRLARSLSALGRFDESHDHLEKSRALATGEHQQALVHFARAQNHILLDQLDPADEELEAGLRRLRDLDLVPLGLFAGANLLRARLLRSYGATGRALAAARRAIEQTRQSGERRFEAEALARAGSLELELGRFEEAEVELREARLLARETEDPRAGCLVELALFASLAERDVVEAGRSLERASELAREIGFGRGEAVALALRSRLQLRRGRPQLALIDSEQALDGLERFGAELSDRITICGSRAAALRHAGATRDAKAAESELRAHVARVRKGVSDRRLARSLGRRADALIARAVGDDLVVEP